MLKMLTAVLMLHSQGTLLFVNRTEVSLPLVNAGDGIYHTIIGIGTPAKRFDLLLDTGTTAFWVPSSECEPGLWKNNRKYDAMSSKSFVDTEDYFVEYYNDGSGIAGLINLEKLHVGNNKLNNVPIGEAVRAENLLGATEYDGILGLALSKTVDPFNLTLLDLMFDRKLISKKVFSMSYPKFHLSDGELLFGGTNPAKYCGPIDYVDVVPGKFWGFQVDSVMIGEHTIAKNFISIADTGSNRVLCSKRYLTKMAQILGFVFSMEDVISIDCNAATSFEPVIFKLNGFELRFQAKDYVETVTTLKSTKCHLNFSPSLNNQSEDDWIIGSTFLRQFYTVYDKEAGKLGFAQPNWKKS